MFLSKIFLFLGNYKNFFFRGEKNFFGEDSKKQSIPKLQNFLPRPALVTKCRAYIRPYLDFGGIAMQCFPCSD